MADLAGMDDDHPHSGRAARRDGAAPARGDETARRRVEAAQLSVHAGVLGCPSMGPIPASWEPNLRSILRIVVAFLFIAHGTQKLFGVPGSRTPVAVMSLLGIASLLETFGGVLIFLGLFT